MHRRLVVLALLLALVPLPALAGPLDLISPAQAPETFDFMAGVGTADMTWHVGAGAGQYADKRYEGDGLPADPHQQSTTQVESYGVQSRLSTRAIVVQGTNGNRVALVKTDNYLAQDLLIRRVGQVLAELGSTISHDEILHAATHNHSSPYYSSPAAGVWIFQDVWDIRAFEYQARQIAAAIKNAEDNLKPARMGATTVSVPDLKANIAGRGTTRDGSPRGYPDDFGDDDIAIVRFDDMSNPEEPKPLGTWMNYGQHPESLEGYNLITADFLAPLERFVDNETGSTLVFSQGDVGSAEGPYEGRVKVADDKDGNVILPDGTIKAWAHSGYAQAERFSRILADAVVAGWKKAGTSEAKVPFTTDVPVAMFDGWVPGPVSHPYPSANACRTEDTIEAQPGVGTAAECSRGPKMTDQFDMVAENLREHGIPVPENYDMPSHMAVEENVRLHLQAVRLGEVLLASCACEAQVDLILNIESRTDKQQNNIWRGYDWSENDCVQDGDNGPWTCMVGGRTVTDIPDAAIKKMQAQVNNDALGWDDPLYAPYANGEPHDVGQIKGNFTHAELSPELGYALTVGIGHAGDYNGYTVSYREYMAYDHYRKALTSYGPHTADYMATRLMLMAEALKGGRPYDPFTDEPLGAQAAADEARQTALATAIGQIASGAYDGYDATVTPDVGTPAIAAQPGNITRFSAAHVSWVGGNNWVDNPTVRVERKVAADRRDKGRGKGRGTDTQTGAAKWVTYATQQGEIPVMVHYPAVRAGSQEWRWTAAFEAFDGGPNPSLGQTPEGTYRFVIEGIQRLGGENVPYVLESAEFTVTRWTGIGQPKSELPLTIDARGTVSAPATFTYPKTYSSPFAAIADDGRDNVARPCKTCTFRPWDAVGEVESLIVTVVRSDGTIERVKARKAGDRFIAPTQLDAGDRAFVAPRDVIDTWGETNAQTLEATR